MRKITILIACSLVAIFGTYKMLFVKSDFLERYSSYCAYPVIKMQHVLVQPIKSYFAHKKSTSELQEQLHALQQERDILLAKNVELSALIDYAQETQELIEFKKRYEFEHCTLAQIIAKNFSDQAQFFLIDKGEHAGIKPDMIALYNDCIIGKIVEVYPYYSKLLLITDQNCKIAAYCAQSKATGIYQGCNQEWSATLNHVSHLSQLEQGDMILSSGDGLVFPRGFGVGKIKSFTTQGLFHKVTVELLVDLHALKYCYIVQKDSTIPDAISA